MSTLIFTSSSSEPISTRHGIVTVHGSGASIAIGREVEVPGAATLSAAEGPLRLEVEGHLVAITREDGGYYVLPLRGRRQRVEHVLWAWILPAERDADEAAWCVRTRDGTPFSVDADGSRATVEIPGGHADATLHAARPRSDAFGHGYVLDLPDGSLLERALAGFYWDTLIPTVAERTLAADAPDADGYVLDTLEIETYSGTYPDVGHAFHVKGRVLSGDPLNLDVVRRMLELQFRLMREDPERAWRNPCAVQLDGVREYHVRRSSLDGSANAVMFLVTGNVEILESAWLYVAVRKDLAWLERHLPDLQGAASLIEDLTDRHGRLWSDVYYEDQVVKDGREAAAQGFAAAGLRYLADLEALVGADADADRHRAQAKVLASALVEPLPLGYWHTERRRFVDWVDRHGDAHDHGSLLAQVVPLLIGAATDDQVAAAQAFLDSQEEAFQRFPSFIAADVAAYGQDEIGIAGPYDLCAIARHWSWDATLLARRGRRERVHAQLCTVARRAEEEGGYLSERYDMDHVYYVDGDPAHGARRYYEYPCTFTWLLFHAYLGIEPVLEADLRLVVRRPHPGRWRVASPGIALDVTTTDDLWIVANVAPEERAVIVDPDRPGEVPRTWSVCIRDAEGTMLRSVDDSRGAHTWRVPPKGVIEAQAKEVTQ